MFKTVKVLVNGGDLIISPREDDDGNDHLGNLQIKYININELIYIGLHNYSLVIKILQLYMTFNQNSTTLL